MKLYFGIIIKFKVINLTKITIVVLYLIFFLIWEISFFISIAHITTKNKKIKEIIAPISYDIARNEKHNQQWNLFVVLIINLEYYFISYNLT